MERSPRDGTKPVRRPRSPLALVTRVCCVALLLCALTAQAASAGVGWCRSDPLVAIGGDLADVFVAAPPDAPLKVTGPTEIVVTVPKRGVSAELVLLKVTDAGIGVRIAVFVPATDDAMPVRVEFAPRVVGILKPAYAEGVANTWVSLTTAL